MSNPLKTTEFLHGGDYNPDQWLDQPDVIKQDFKAFKTAKLNTVTLESLPGTSWSLLRGSMILAG